MTLTTVPSSGVESSSDRDRDWASRPPTVADARTSGVPHAMWTNRGRGTWTSVEVVDGACVVCVEGLLDVAALQPCRAALDAALALHPACIVVNLERAAPPVSETLPLLSAARRYVRRRGASMTLIGLPDSLVKALCGPRADHRGRTGDASAPPAGATSL